MTRHLATLLLLSAAMFAQMTTPSPDCSFTIKAGLSCGVWFLSSTGTSIGPVVGVVCGKTGQYCTASTSLTAVLPYNVITVDCKEGQRLQFVRDRWVCADDMSMFEGIRLPIPKELQ